MDMEDQSKIIGAAKRVYALFGERNINAILNMLSPDVVWGEPDNPYNPAGGTRHGHVGFLEWVNIGREAEEIQILEPRNFMSGGDTVAVSGYMKCLAKTTGRVYESDFVHLFTFKENKIIRFQEFFDTYTAGEEFRRE